MTATKVSQAPCAKCPFRKDVPVYLRAERRAEIARSLLGGQTFWCHATVDYSEEDEEGFTIPDATDAAVCAGSVRALAQIGSSTNYMRVLERLGYVDLAAVEVNGAECWDLNTWQTLPEGATGDDPGEPDDLDDIETCVNSDGNCLAPAGWMVGGGIVQGTEEADGRCVECGEGLCSECADEHGRCASCGPYYD